MLEKWNILDLLVSNCCGKSNEKAKWIALFDLPLKAVKVNSLALENQLIHYFVTHRRRVEMFKELNGRRLFTYIRMYIFFFCKLNLIKIERKTLKDDEWKNICVRVCVFDFAMFDQMQMCALRTETNLCKIEFSHFSLRMKSWIEKQSNEWYDVMYEK